MPSLILPVVSGLAGFLGGGPKTTTTTQSGTSNTQGSQSGGSTATSSQSPTLSAIQQFVQNLGINTAVNNLQNNPYQPGGSFETSQMQGINQAANNSQQIAKNLQAQNGTEFSPYAAYATMIPQNARVAQDVNLQEQLPQLSSQYQSQQLGNLLQAGGFGGFGSTSTGSGTSYGTTSGSTQSNQTTTGVSPNQQLPGLFSGLGAGLAAPSGGYTIGPNGQQIGVGPSNLSTFMQSLGIGGSPTPSGPSTSFNSPNYQP